MAASVEVLAVPEGSLIVFKNVMFSDGDAADDAMVVANETCEAIGHRRWCLVNISDGADVEVWGPDVDLARVRALLDR